jgi:hypothetical protein
MVVAPGICNHKMDRHGLESNAADAVLVYAWA